MQQTEWPKVVPLLQYALNHRPRKALGGRSPIEVMTGRAPDMAIDLVLWTGVNLKDGVAIEAGVEQVDKYCDKLEASLTLMHTAIHDAELLKQRKKAAAEANSCCVAAPTVTAMGHAIAGRMPSTSPRLVGRRVSPRRCA